MSTKLDAENLKEISDSELLAVAEQIIQEDIKKSQASGLEGNDEDEKLGETQGKMPESGQEDKGSAPQEANPKNKKKDESEMKKSQEAIEGKETGGLAPSVQGMLPEQGGGSKGDAQDEANPKALAPKPSEEEAKNKNKEKKPTQDGDAQDEANQASQKPSVPQGGSSEGHPTQQGDSQSEANANSVKPGEEKLSKSEVAQLVKLVRELSSEVQSLKKSLAKTEEKPLKKSTVHAEILEKLSKSYISQIEAQKAENETLKKSVDSLQKSHEELVKSLKKPAAPRQSLSSVTEVQKGGTTQPIYKSKGDVLAKLEELRKSGKVTGDDIISFNASGFLSEAARKALAQ
jgi:hypothetical protein